ncbi:DUF1189 family protein [Thalassobacillus hwangdonensis]|uniref:DUF1189 family protein n=1 Tax=Thalassobacillus hwangdonensis TaxID=546108 RepID=A0ABW3KZW1_9BACI
MNKTTQLIKSFYNFKMIGAFRILPIGKSIGYIFFLSLIVLIPVMASMLLSLLLSTSESVGGGMMKGISGGVFSIIFLPFIYLFISFFLMVMISFLSWLAYIYSVITHKRINYKQLWVVTSFAVTAPTLILVIVESFIVSVTSLVWVYLLGCMLYILLSLRYVPSKK